MDHLKNDDSIIFDDFDHNSFLNSPTNQSKIGGPIMQESSFSQDLNKSKMLNVPK